MKNILDMITMVEIEYFVSVPKEKREEFYNYMHNLGYEDSYYDKEYMLKSSYPFGVCMSLKTIQVIESATQCYFTQKAGKMKTFEEFKQIIEQSN